MSARTGGVRCRVVVADDEPVAASALAADLRRLGADVVAVTAGGAAAVAACVQHGPDACFTDIVMPDVDGLSVAAAIRRAAPRTAVVFVSAHPHYAVAAFGADVVDYVLKPVRRDRLAEALGRVLRAQAVANASKDGSDGAPVRTPHGPGSSREEHADDRVTGGSGSGAHGADDRLLVTERGAVHVIAVDDLEWVQADGYAVWLHTATRSWLLRERLHLLEARLRAADFIRVHRSALVRRGAIVHLEWTEPAAPVAVLASGARVRVARDRVPTVRALLAEPGGGDDGR
jgi:DNA-binding LytR/AlgR family response regulator